MRDHEAQTITRFWRRLNQASGDLCFAPAYWLKFYSNNDLVFETIVCFGCQVLVLPDGEFWGFDARGVVGAQLLKQLNAVPAIAQQIVGPERRERVSYHHWCGEGCVKSRRPVNSDVGHLTSSHNMTETNEPLIVDVDLKESDLQRANFWFGLKSWSNRLMLAIMPIAGLLLLWKADLSTLFERPLRQLASFYSLAFRLFILR